MAPKRVPKWAPEGRPRLPKGHIGALRRPALSRGLLHKAFFCCWFWLCSCLCFWFWFCFFVCVVAFFVHSFVLYVFMCACFWLCVLFPVVVFLFYAFVFAMFEDCLTDSRATSKRHATCSRMSPSGLVEMLIRLECFGSAPVVTVPL